MTPPDALNVLAREIDAALIAAGHAVPVRSMGNIFGDLLWEPLGDNLLADRPVVYETGSRYCALWRFPDGIRYFAAPLPAIRIDHDLDPEIWEVGILLDVPAAAAFITEWLAGTLASKIAVRRKAPPSIWRPRPWQAR